MELINVVSDYRIPLVLWVSKQKQAKIFVQTFTLLFDHSCSFGKMQMLS